MSGDTRPFPFGVFVPPVSVHTALVRFRGITGNIMQGTLITVDDDDNITMPKGSTINGRSVFADGVKLDGIELRATRDQTGAEIVVLLEALIVGARLSHNYLDDVGADDHHDENHSIVSHNDTTATGAELEALTDDSMVDGLHRHSEVSSPDGVYNRQIRIDNNGVVHIGDGTNELQIEVDGTIRFINNATVYEDLQISISNIRIPASNAPTQRLYNHGIGGGVTFPVLGFALNEFFFFDTQAPHSMELSTVLDNHIHYMTPTDGTGKKFKFQLDVITAVVNGNWAVPSGSPFTKEVSMIADLSNKHKKEIIADIPAVNTTVSTVYSCRLERIDASSDEYGSEIYIKFNDGHFRKDTVGSRTELDK